MPLTGGQTFAGYKIIRLLGSGGMGEVYLAQHPRLPRQDALKVLRADVSNDASFRERFIREADLAAGLRHPNIVGVHDRGEHEGQLWLSMDYVDGLDAAGLLQQRYSVGLPIELAVTIVTAVARALDYAHKKGVLHRDVKPANIMLTHLGDEEDQQILLTDFGIARNVNEISGITATNMTVGTVAYCAPEQLLGEDVDGRADQYALAATAYHLLTGSQLFPHSNPAVVISRHLNIQPPALAETRPELARLDPVLAIGLTKRPEKRFKRCSDFARALSEKIDCASGATSSAPTVSARRAASPKAAAPSHAETVDPTRAAARQFTSHRRWFAPAAVLAAIGVTGIVALAWHPWTRTETSTFTSPSSALSQTSKALASPGLNSPAASPPASTTATTPLPAITDVDPTSYQNSEYPGYYQWVYARTPSYRECSIFPVAHKSTEPEGLSCSVEFPPGTPDADNPPFHGTPNYVQIILPDGPTNMIGEGSVPTAKTLLPNHRITVGVFSCTALVGGGISCDAPTGGFTFTNGVLTKRGPS